MIVWRSETVMTFHSTAEKLNTANTIVQCVAKP
jgi:hypothetical protein